MALPNSIQVYTLRYGGLFTEVLAKALDQNFEYLDGLAGGVTSFNSRIGAVTLLIGDVTGALGYTPMSRTANLSDVASVSTARTNLGVAIGANVQAWSAGLDALAALATINKIYYLSAANTWTAVTIGSNLTFSGGTLSAAGSAGALLAANNLSDVANAGTSRTNLGLGTSAIVNTGTSGATIPLLNGANTWASVQTLSVAPVFTDASGTRTALGLGSVATLTSGVAAGNLDPVVVGSVLQMAAITDVGTNGTNTSFANYNSSNVIITPRSAASKLLIRVSLDLSGQALAANNVVWTIQLYDVDNATLIGQPQPFQAPIASGGVGLEVGAEIAAIVTNAVTSARSFQLRAKTSNASSSITAQNMVWSITEIKT